MVRHNLIILQQVPEHFGRLYIKGLTSTGKHLSKTYNKDTIVDFEQLFVHKEWNY